MNSNKIQPAEGVCPFLGLRYDIETRYGFPNPGNHCHRERNPRPINLDYQQNVCLGAAYQKCPIFLQQGPPGAGVLANPTEQPAVAGARSLLSYGWFRLFAGLILIVGSLGGMFLLSQGAGDGDDLNGTSPAPASNEEILIPVEIPTETSSAMAISPTATNGQTDLPSPTGTLPETGTATETGTPTGTASPTGTALPTSTASPTASSTVPVLPPPPTLTPGPTLPGATPPPSATQSPPTASSVPPTQTPQPSNTPVPPTNTPVPPTNTPVPPTNTPISDVPTDTPSP